MTGVEPKSLEGYVTYEQIQEEFNISRSTLNRHMERGRIKKYKWVGDRHVYFKRTEIEGLVKNPQIVQEGE